MSSGSPFFVFMGDTSQLPWSTIVRHTIAFCLYLLALVQWPGYMVSEWAGEDRSFAYSLTSLMFTLAFWCACLFHYLVSAGRVQVNWRSGRVRAKGWIVKTSRRAHRVLLSLTLAISAMTIIQSTTTAMIINHFYIREDDPHPKEHAILILLKVNQTLAFVLFVYVLGRLVFEPVSIRKPRRRNATTVSEKPDEENAKMNLTKDPICPEEAEACNICIERCANRLLGCGHVICCCCLHEIWRTEHFTTPRCPFCRGDIGCIKKLQLIDAGAVEIQDCCEQKGKSTEEENETPSEGQSESTTRAGSIEQIDESTNERSNASN